MMKSSMQLDRGPFNGMKILLDQIETMLDLNTGQNLSNYSALNHCTF